MAAIGGVILLVTLFFAAEETLENDIMPSISTASYSTQPSISTEPSISTGGDVGVSDGGIMMVNESSVTVYRMFMTTNSDGDWGDDVLGSSIIGSGESLPLALSQGSASYNILIEDSDGGVYEFYNLIIDPDETLIFTDASGGTIEHYYSSGELYQEVVAGGGSDPGTGAVGTTAVEGSVAVANEASFTIWRLYISESTDESWGEDLLGSSVISSGETLSIDLPQGSSTYDVRVETEDGVYYDFYGLIIDPDETLVFTEANGGTIEHYYASGEFYQEVLVS